MRQSWFTMEESIRIIVESHFPGSALPAQPESIKYGIKEATLYRWRAKYKGMGVPDAKQLKVLEDENRRLKKLVADKELIIQTLNEILKRNF